MLLLRGYDQWHRIFFLGDHFSAVARGRKLYCIVLVYEGSAFVVLCRRVLVCGRQLLGMSCAQLVVPPLTVSLRRVGRLVSGVMMAVVVARVYG